ncbi:hypothetical protein AYO40_04075 [Planctomycetaceae bacterium SCGC AG-212-D15]|nr:hypothetical protein AYO40_04075 [Planctomycetaceae bacterium SCGC AG-212-D15]
MPFPRPAQGGAGYHREDFLFADMNPDLEEVSAKMLQTLVSSAGRLLGDLGRSWIRERFPLRGVRTATPPASSKYRPLRRLTLTDEVSRTLFEEYSAHRNSRRGDDETGWVLLGHREVDEAVVLATLPAGARCSSGVAHVQFNSSAQALGSCIVRQHDRRLRTLGVVHTHPGSLRHPSDGDFRGDCQWVRQLAGGEGVFGIGTVDARGRGDGLFARQPRPHVQALGPLTFCWYALGPSDPDYRPLPYTITLGPDLARPLHPLWSSVEGYAEQLERLYRQLAGVTFEVLRRSDGSALSVNIPLAEPDQSLRVLLEGSTLQYYLLREGDVIAVDPGESRIDRAVYLLLAELAAQAE